MILQEIFDLIVEYRWQVFIVLFTTIVQISPLNINPWSKIGSFFKWLFKHFGKLLSPLILDDVKVLNAELIKKLDSLEDKLGISINDSINRHEDSLLEYKRLKSEIENEIKGVKELITYEVNSTKLELMRPVILRFVGDVKAGIHFDKETWDTMRDVCVKYVTFCQNNKQFLNSLIDGALNYVLDGWAREAWKEK